MDIGVCIRFDNSYRYSIDDLPARATAIEDTHARLEPSGELTTRLWPPCS